MPYGTKTFFFADEKLLYLSLMLGKIRFDNPCELSFRRFARTIKNYLGFIEALYLKKFIGSAVAQWYSA